LTAWWLGLMESREEKLRGRDLRLWRRFDFANRIPPFFFTHQFCVPERIDGGKEGNSRELLIPWPSTAFMLQRQREIPLGLLRYRVLVSC
jgi:hypothetical protein